MRCVLEKWRRIFAAYKIYEYFHKVYEYDVIIEFMTEFLI